MSLRILAARGCLCTCPAGTQRQDDASEGHPEQEEQERRSELRIQEHPVDQACRSCERRQYSEPDGQDARLQGYYSNGCHHHAQRQHGDDEGHAVHLVQGVVELGREPRLLGRKRRSNAAELDREVHQTRAEGGHGEPTSLSLCLAQYAVEVAEERQEEEHPDQLNDDDEVRFGADAREPEEQHHVQQPAEGTEPGPEQFLHFRSPSETPITMPERYETWLVGASCRV